MTLDEAKAIPSCKTNGELADFLEISIFATYNWDKNRISYKRADALLKWQRDHADDMPDALTKTITGKLRNPNAYRKLYQQKKNRLAAKK